MVSFASNDYLGLSSHPTVIMAATAALERWGTGSGASRLVTGSRPVHSELERALAGWKETERAVIFPTGFTANLSVLSVLGGPDVCVLSDELNHASIIDGCRLSRSRVSIYRHNDLEQLTQLLEQERAGAAGPTMVVTDSVFSMDGDVAPVGEIAAICQHYGTLLVLDEAHAVLGPDLPPHLARSTGTGDELMLVRVGTLSKTLGSLGGFVAAPQPVIDILLSSEPGPTSARRGSQPASSPTSGSPASRWRRASPPSPSIRGMILRASIRPSSAQRRVNRPRSSASRIETTRSRWHHQWRRRS